MRRPRTARRTRKLCPIQLRIEPVLRKQLLMAPLLRNIAVPHRENDIRISDGRKPVHNHKARAALHELLHGTLDQMLCPRIDGGGRLVEDQDRLVG